VIALTVAKFGSMFANMTSPIIFRATESVAQPFWVSVYVYTFAFLAMITVNHFEYKRERNKRKLSVYHTKMEK